MFPLEALLVFKVVKHASLMGFAAGLLGAHGAESADRRRLFAYRFAAPSFLAVCTSGVLLAFGAGVSLLSLWIALGFLGGLWALHFAAWAASKEQRRTTRAAICSALGVLVAIGAMVFKPSAS